MKLRPYQREAVDSLYEYFRAGKVGNPLVVVPTGGGKSLIQASFVKEVIEQWPSQRFLLLTHVKELLEQNGEELVKLWPGAETLIGYYNAALKRRDTDSQITIASIQSIYKRAHMLGRIDLVMIDEAHLVPPKGEGMYREFLGKLSELCPAAKVIGLTATPFRLGQGMLHKGEGAIFTDISHSVDIKDLIAQGHLAPLTTKLSRARADLSGVKIRAGEYASNQLETAMSDERVVEDTCAEIRALAEGRNKLLVFCCGLKHAAMVENALIAVGVSAKTVTGKTPKTDREQIVSEYKMGSFRALVNVNALTTGFNVRDIDCLALLRPTKSTALYCQMLGRGMRTYPGKEDCLVLDFAGNILEHGPVDKIEIKNKSGGSEVSTAPQKECPECGALCAIAARECLECGHEYPDVAVARHDTKAHTGVAVITPDLPQWHDVEDVTYREHHKPGKPPSMRVTYLCGLFDFSEWICFEHDGYARKKAVEWWAARTSAPAPETVADAIPAAAFLPEPARVMVSESGEYPRIIRYDFSKDSKENIAHPDRAG